MSDATANKLAAAIQEHVADEFDGRVAADWVLVVSAAGINDGPSDSSYFIETSTSPLHALKGLIQIAGEEQEKVE